MTVTLVVNSVSYFYPETGDTNWGAEATEWASAVTTGMLQKAGGLFTLLAEADFGASYGLKSLYYKSRTADVATAGQMRLARADVISWRNQANSANLDLSVNSSNVLLFNGVALGNFVTVADTNSMDLTLSGGGQLTADLKLSAASASASNQLVTLSIESDGLKAQITDARIIAAVPNASSSVTGLLTNTDWTTFNSKQAAGSYITALTSDVTASGPGSAAATIASGAVSLAKMANLAANSIIGNNTGGAATPLALTVTQTTAMLNAMVGDSGAGGTKGLVPAPAAGDAAAVKFLKADGTWATTPAGPTQATASTLGIVQGGTVPGQISGGAVAAGYLGEYIASILTSGSAVTLNTGAAKTITSISLTAGDWDVTGLVIFTGTATGITYLSISLSTVTNTGGTMGDNKRNVATTNQFTISDSSMDLANYRVSVSSTTTIYLIGEIGFSASNAFGYGKISARRVG